MATRKHVILQIYVYVHFMQEKRRAREKEKEMRGRGEISILNNPTDTKREDFNTGSNKL